MREDNVMIVRPAPNAVAGQWTPVARTETIDFLSHVVPSASREGVSRAAVSILSKSHPPTAGPGQQTGLVVGYVQSGKTMSFEALATLACDNAFHIVIVIAGISNALLEQSTQRLRRDLRLDEANRPRKWVLFQNPSLDDGAVQTIRDVLDDRRDKDTPKEYIRTVLITVLKNHTRLQGLVDLMNALEVGESPVLIIDDEADQASLNNEVNQQSESTTYRRLMSLRQSLPTHTYVQYTATPQAPLLINIIDSLSPNFVEVLDPGQAYVGGLEFFSGDLRYVRVIPPLDVPTSRNILTGPPESLLKALRVFMIGVAAGIRKSQNIGNRSMLVHPSHLTAHHQEYYNWIVSVVDSWKRILVLPTCDPDRQELIEEFRIAHVDVGQTVDDDLPAFDELEPHLQFAFRNTRVLEVNARSGRTPEVEWRGAYGWILVGGQAMDRGFTVEGLTVTYMPRGTGVGNADTVQQRGRFFGYKRSYLGFCRVYIEQETVDAFQSYVQHEEDIRSQLKGIQESGESLNEWKRAFVLDPALRPCRDVVLEFDFIRGGLWSAWIVPRIVHASEEVAKFNRAAVAEFVDGLSFEQSSGHSDRTPIQCHDVCSGISLRSAVKHLLLSVRITGTVDAQRKIGLLLQLSKALEDNPDEVCRVYRMSPNGKRRRRIDASGAIINLFQGEAPVYPAKERGKVYPGDRAICDDENVTFQIHTIDLLRRQDVVQENVTVIAVRVPQRLSRPWIFQVQR